MEEHTAHSNEVDGELYANPYDRHWEYRADLLDVGPRFFVRTRLMQRYFPPRFDQVLDVGCGDGQFLAQLESMGIRAEGLDGSRRAIEICRHRLRDAENRLHCCFIEDFQPSRPFDLLLCGEVLEHIEDDRAFLREIHRLAAPGATFIATVPLDMSLWSRADEEAGHFRRYTVEECLTKIREAGFEILDWTVWGFPLTRYSMAFIRRQQTRMIHETTGETAGGEGRRGVLKRLKFLLRPIKYLYLFDNLFNFTRKGVGIVVKAARPG